MKYLLSFCIVLAATIGLAQTVAVTVERPDATSLVLRSEDALRYAADYGKGTLFVYDSILAASFEQPQGARLNQTQDGLEFVFEHDFNVMLAENERSITIELGSTLGETQIELGDDERAPVIYYLSNADPNETATLLRGMYANLSIQVDERQRALYMLVSAEDRILVDNLIESMDAARPQVMFEAEIIEINQSVTESLGIDYDSLFSFSLSEAPTGDSTAAGYALGQFGDFSRNGLQLKFGINLLKANSAAEVLARPRVTTMDGVEAQLNATQNFPIVSTTEAGQKSVQSITTGINMVLLPKVSPDGTIEAELSISVSTPTGITTDKVPTFSSRDASTTVRVRNGESIVIGGLLEKRNLQGQNKVPVLGDIPLLGALFTSTSTEQSQTDLVIVVTPRIVDMPTALSLP